jgi:hypothetical protein
VEQAGGNRMLAPVISMTVCSFAVVHDHDVVRPKRCEEHCAHEGLEDFRVDRTI